MSCSLDIADYNSIGDAASLTFEYVDEVSKRNIFGTTE